MNLGLKGRTGIVTGGSRGIGKAIALELAREGVDLVIVARDSDRLASATKDIVEATGNRVIPISCDVRDRIAVEATFTEAVAQLGSLNIVIRN